MAYYMADTKGCRREFRVMEDFGEWLQVSVFQCCLSVQCHTELIALLDGSIHHSDDHLILVDVGLADQVVPRVVSFGKTFSAVGREPIII